MASKLPNDRNLSKPKGQGGAGKANVAKPIKSSNGQRAAPPSVQKTKPTKAPGAGTNGNSSGANKLSRP